jgi:hypothetical protein
MSHGIFFLVTPRVSAATCDSLAVAYTKVSCSPEVAEEAMCVLKSGGPTFSASSSTRCEDIFLRVFCARLEGS